MREKIKYKRGEIEDYGEEGGGVNKRQKSEGGKPKGKREKTLQIVLRVKNA